MARQYLFERIFDHDENQEYETATTETPAGAEAFNVGRRYIEDGIDVAARPLCNSCALLDLQSTDFTSSPTKTNQTDHIPFGLFSEFSIRDCPLCRLVVRVLQTKPTLYATISALHGNVPCELIWTTRHNISSYREDPEDHRLIVQVRFPRSTQRTAPAIQLFSTPDRPQLFRGRLYPEDRIDLDVVKLWLKCCEDWHRGECIHSPRESLPHPASQMTLYVIDVVSMNLHAIGEQEQFCALSYVWGGVDQYKLTKDTLPSLLKPGTLRDVISSISVTIQDAINLDDDDFKLTAIDRMHLVYSKAYLAIVAASGGNANAGLPGYREHSRGIAQACETIREPNFLLGVIPLYDSLLQHSPYSQRCWTYQEFCFSPRSLVFLDGMLYFQCQQAVWSENVVAEHAGAKTYMYEWSCRLSSQEPLQYQYRKVIREFTRRELSCRSDILKAFSGQSQYLKTLDPSIGDSIQGVHFNLFPWITLWRSCPESIRRKGFPSWSWAGWIGEALLPYPPSVVAFHKWRTNSMCGTTIYYKSLRVWDAVDVDDVLVLASVTATYYLDPRAVFENDFVNPLWRLRDARGHVCGLIQIHDFSTYIEKYWQLDDGIIKVIVLSDMLPHQGQFLNSASRLEYDADAESDPNLNPDPDSNAQPTTPPIHHSPTTCTGNEGNHAYDWDLPEHVFDYYNILLVRRHKLVRKLQPAADGSDNLEVKDIRWFWERVGVGILHNKALQWAVEAEGPLKEIILLE